MQVVPTMRSSMYHVSIMFEQQKLYQIYETPNLSVFDENE